MDHENKSNTFTSTLAHLYVPPAAGDRIELDLGSSGNVDSNTENRSLCVNATNVSECGGTSRTRVSERKCNRTRHRTAFK
jgi:hypothetical protein